MNLTEYVRLHETINHSAEFDCYTLQR